MILLLALLLAASPVLPQGHGAFGPAQVSTLGGGGWPSADFDDQKACGGCHRDIAAQWRTSAHAWASFNNPLYRVSIEGLRSEVGTTPSRMCAGCHDLALLTQGAMEASLVSPDDPRAVAGVSCSTCHSTVHASRDGNGSLTLTTSPALPPQSTLAQHRARVASTTLRTNELCAACHRSFLDQDTGNAAAFFGMDDFGAFQRSAWNGSLAERPDHVKATNCRGCHMAREPAVLGDVAAKQGTVPSHRFLGAHTLLAAMRGDADQLARTQAFLKGAVSISLSAARVEGDWLMPASRVTPRAGAPLELEVTLFNEAVGHRFPGGVLDNQDTRVELTLRTAQGRVLGSSDEHQLRAEVVDAQGNPLSLRETNRFLAAVWNHTLPPRDARVARYRFVLPEVLRPEELPLTAQARVLHRARLPALREAACTDAQTPRGQAFGAASARLTGVALDPCVEAPVTEVATAELSLDGRDGKVEWRAAFRRGLGLAAGLQESLDDARAALLTAWSAVPASERAGQGQIAWGLGAVAARRGQLAEALGWLSQAGQRLGPTAALAKSRGDAFAQVWRWREAAVAYREAAALAPEDLQAWQALTMAEASAGHPTQALAAAQAGLRLQPRDADCLRVQAQVLRAQGAPAPLQDEALEAALHWRTPDGAPAARAGCSRSVPGCAARRNPVPVFEVAPRAIVGVAVPDGQ
jgi:tetratricopeptide (TPR) repeat protein